MEIKPRHGMEIKPRHVAFLVAAAAGLVFAGFSTFDFALRLDRQVHDIHCSFVPGLLSADHSGSSGCHSTMMSPYSSWFRTQLWGGIPIALPAMSVFSFLVFRGVELLSTRGRERHQAAQILFATSFIPVVASVAMGLISWLELQAACKVCIGIYVSSFVAMISAAAIVHDSRNAALSEDAADLAGPLGRAITVWGAQIGVFVAVPALVYATNVPDYTPHMGDCGDLLSTEDPNSIMVDLEAGPSAAVEAIEVFDPLCPACRAFEHRFAASGFADHIRRRAVLFPLDDACNWMVSAALHPGACTISEAILCADTRSQVSAQAVIQWAFTHQAEILTATRNDPALAKPMVEQAFPALKGCIGSDKARAKLNRSLRWTVKNKLSVLTPQLYVDGRKLCDEDTDLGMEYALTQMLASHRSR
ncbi:MAG: vitamin K epoxide reductase family protein [Nannocystaceae bacterium]